MATTEDLPPGVAFLTITDYGFFPGTVATVNSIFHHHPGAEVIVVNRTQYGLTSPQRRLLELGGVRVLDSDRFESVGRHIGPWELKAYAACDLAPDYDMIIGIDSDCVLCAGVGDTAFRARATGRLAGGRDGDGATYDETYAKYGIQPGEHNPNYMSTSLYFCPMTPSNRNLLTQWAYCTSQAVYNGKGDYPGHGDQGILNCLMYVRDRGGGPELLDNETWSQHWKYWQSVVVYEQGRFLNNSREKCRQRSFHCGGAEKFWEPGHRDRVISTNPAQASNYAWWLYMFWFGLCRDWSIDPASYLPEPARHLCEDLVNFFGLMRQFSERLTLFTPDSSGLISRLVDGIRGCMNVGGSLDDYIEIVRACRRGPALWRSVHARVDRSSESRSRAWIVA